MRGILIVLPHRVAGFGQVEHGALHLGHDLDRVGDTLARNARVTEPLEREVVGSAGGSAVDLNRPCLHRVRNSNRLVNVLGEDTSLEEKKKKKKKKKKKRRTSHYVS